MDYNIQHGANRNKRVVYQLDDTSTWQFDGEKVTAAENLPYPPSFDAALCHRAAVILTDLAPDVARDCLLILTQSMQQQAVKSPLGYLYGLVQAFHVSSLLPR